MFRQGKWCLFGYLLVASLAHAEVPPNLEGATYVCSETGLTYETRINKKLEDRGANAQYSVDIYKDGKQLDVSESEDPTGFTAFAVDIDDGWGLALALDGPRFLMSSFDKKNKPTRSVLNDGFFGEEEEISCTLSLKSAVNPAAE